MDSTKNDFMFSTIDPLGRTIVLKTYTWDNHINDEHNEVGIDEIKQNIQDPKFIIPNNKETTSDEKREVYFNLKINNSRLYTQKTVVEFKAENTYGEVVTNYILRKMNENITEGGVIYDSSANQDTNGKANL